MVFFRKLFSHEINPANSERLYSLRKNSKSCHPERSEGSALAENKADSSPRQKLPRFGMTSFGLFPQTVEPRHQAFKTRPALAPVSGVRWTPPESSNRTPEA